jgi:hypothetical protein
VVAGYIWIDLYSIITVFVMMMVMMMKTMMMMIPVVGTIRTLLKCIWAILLAVFWIPLPLRQRLQREFTRTATSVRVSAILLRLFKHLIVFRRQARQLAVAPRACRRHTLQLL